MTSELIAAVVGFILSFLVESVPGFKELWADFKYKALTIAGAGVLVIAAVVGLSYAGAPIVPEVPKPFVWTGLWASLQALIAYLLATQTAYLLQASSLKRKQDAHE